MSGPDEPEPAQLGEPASTRAEPPETESSDGEVPPLDAVDSRWWYWIVAYPVVSLLIFPFILLFGFFGLMSFGVVGSGMQPGPGFGVVFGLIGLVFVLLLLVLILAGLVVFVMLPVALYMDARAVSSADYEWNPDPLLYGILGALPFLVTPLIGLVVAVYYLFQRHEHVGVP